MSRLRMWCIGIFWMLPWAAAPCQETADLVQARNQFFEAERSLRQGNYAQFQSLLAGLRDYPLYPYLLHADLERRLGTAKSEEIIDFLNKYDDSPLAGNLRTAWLRMLAGQKRWTDYLKFYTPLANAELQCHYHLALYRAGKTDEAFQDAERLWLTGKSQSDACDPLFSAWHKAGGLTANLVWQRVHLAMEAGELDLARHLKRYLAPADAKWVDLWIEVYRNPVQVTTNRALAADHPQARAIAAYGVRRMARSNPEAAADAWDRVKARYSFDTPERAAVERRLGLALATRNARQGLGRLASIEPELTDKQTREWRVRAALGQEDWNTALTWIDRLNGEERDEERWQYWRARALEALGQGQEAAEVYAQLARSRSYYGFLAADRKGLPYQFEDRPLAFSADTLAGVEKIPGIARARELYVLGRMTDARREWQFTMRRMNEDQLNQAAKLAHQWGWHDRAILTLARSSHRDDLELRFPIVHQQDVLAHAEAQRIDPAWAFAVMRQESAFMADARSRVGALGLMQIMPNTGKQLAQVLNTTLPHPRQLLDIGTNIRFGITYLRRMLNETDDNTVMATAAYNAGLGRVRQWTPQQGAMPADLWVEMVPFYETRDYLTNVLTYTAIYEYRMGRTPMPLNQRMPHIGNPATVLREGSRNPKRATPGTAG